MHPIEALGRGSSTFSHVINLQSPSQISVISLLQVPMLCLHLTSQASLISPTSTSSSMHIPRPPTLFRILDKSSLLYCSTSQYRFSDCNSSSDFPIEYSNKEIRLYPFCPQHPTSPLTQQQRGRQCISVLVANQKRKVFGPRMTACTNRITGKFL